jgi:hypothetical protein
MRHSQLQLMDTVRYTGEALRNKYGKDMKKDTVGEIVGRSLNEEGVFIVDFGKDAYIVDERNLVRHSFKDTNVQAGPEIERILRKWGTEDEEKKR